MLRALVVGTEVRARMESRPRCQALLIIVVGLALPFAASGCSGPGSAPQTAELRSLRSLAGDHLTALVLVKQWLSILYTKREAPTRRAAGGCPPKYERLPSQPGDPSGTERWRGTMSDCTIVEVYYGPGGVGSQTLTFPDGQTKSMTFHYSGDGGGDASDIRETLWDGTLLEYDTSQEDDYDEERGTATLADGRTMGFVHRRAAQQDQLRLTPDDGSRLSLEVAITKPWSTRCSPVFAEGATGVYRNPSGQRLSFKVWGDGGTRWERWQFSLPDGTTGLFTVGEGFAGTGVVRQGGTVSAALRWGPDGEGTLEPLGAAVVQAVPSAAARDFHFDEWIRNVAALGPMPMY